MGKYFNINIDLAEGETDLVSMLSIKNTDVLRRDPKKVHKIDKYGIKTFKFFENIYYLLNI